MCDIAPDGVAVYSGDGLRMVPPDPWRGAPGRGAVLDELLQAVEGRRQPLHDGRWGKATMEVCIAMLQSARERREVTLVNQVGCSGG